MKMKIIIILVILLVLIFFTFFTTNKKKTQITDIESFRFSYTTGYHINAYVIYTLEYKKNKYIASIKPNDVKEEKTIEKKVNKKFIKNLKNILTKYNVNEWNGFQKTDKNVLDGNSFSLYIKMQDGNIAASGYMKWPKNYSKVKQELDKLFSKIYKKASN